MKIKIWHISLLFAAAILFIRFDLFLLNCRLLFSYFNILVSDFDLALSQFDLELADYVLSTKLLIIFPIALVLLRKKYPLNKPVSFASLSMIIILTAFIFAPYVTTTNPNFQKDISVAKLLPPLSELYQIKISVEEKKNRDNIDNFLSIRRSAVKQVIDTDLHYADSVVYSGEELIFFKKNKKETIKSNVAAAEKKIFILGTDEYGRDVFSRLIYGVRVSLLIGLAATIISFLLGLTLGFTAGFSGGFLDNVLNRFTESFLAFPIIFLIILILALFGNSIIWVVIVLGFSGWMSLFKIVRGEVLQINNKDFFISAKMLGLRRRDLMIKEVLPVILAPLIVNLVFQYGNVILAESTLSYLGLGVGDDYPSWGKMIEQGQAHISRAWWLIFFPGIALIFVLLTANKIGRDINKEINPNLAK